MLLQRTTEREAGAPEPEEGCRGRCAAPLSPASGFLALPLTPLLPKRASGPPPGVAPKMRRIGRIYCCGVRASTTDGVEGLLWAGRGAQRTRGQARGFVFFREVFESPLPFWKSFRNYGARLLTWQSELMVRLQPRGGQAGKAPANFSVLSLTERRDNLPFAGESVLAHPRLTRIARGEHARSYGRRECCAAPVL